MGCNCKKNKSASRKSRKPRNPGVIKLSETDLTNLVRKVIKEKQRK